MSLLEMVLLLYLEMMDVGSSLGVMTCGQCCDFILVFMPMGKSYISKGGLHPTHLRPFDVSHFTVQ